MSSVNFLVIGGSGQLCELNHYPAIRSLAKDGIEARVVAICDPRNPRDIDPYHYNSGRDNLNAILSNDNPLWIDPRRFKAAELEQYLSKLAKDKKVDIVIIATDPAQHYFYANWAVAEAINVLCDKPLVVELDASWNTKKAVQIEKKFQSLYRKVELIQKKNKNYIFCTPLRRRALTSFVAIAENLQTVYDKTNEGITYLNAIVNNGIHRYPAEFLKGGAHGFLDGIGSLSHSSYHYLDVIAWYLQCAPGKVAKIGITLPYIVRVKDYIARQGYEQMLKLNDEDPSVVVSDILLPDRVLNSEIDFTLHLHLYDNSNTKVGLISYTSNHATYSPRTTKYERDMLDHANDINGGRMSQIYFDIHQGSIQNLQLIKNDIVFKGNHITLNQRLHPKLGDVFSENDYADAYDSDTVTMQDLFVSFVKKSIGVNIPAKHDEHLQLLRSQKLTHRLFSSAYVLIAKDFAYPGKSNQIMIEL